MKKHSKTALLTAVLLSACTMTGCFENVKFFFAHDGTYPEPSSSEASSAEVTTEGTTQTTEEVTTETVTETTAATEKTTAKTTAPASANDDAQDDDTKLLWSERGLEIVALEDTSGYGSELRAGEKYLDWTLISFDGQTDGESVSALEADFAYENGALSANGIVTVLPADDAAYPNGLYLRVDNQADFPYFPADTRERGKFIIENSEEVYKMLGYEDASKVTQKEFAVTVSITALHINYGADGYDTIMVSAASLR